MRKKIRSIFVASMMFSLVGTSIFCNYKDEAKAAEATKAKPSYELKSETASYDTIIEFDIEDGVLLAYNGYDRQVVIPESVTVIDSYAFYGNEVVESIEIPDTVEGIGVGAFQGCINLTTITLQENKKFTTIPSDMCKDCEALTAVTIPDSVTSINGAAFLNCIKLESVQFGEGVLEIGGSAFENCISLEAVELPEELTRIEAMAFAGDECITSLELSPELEYIGYQGFKDCIGLTEIEIPKSLDECNSWTGGVFEGCSNLKTVIFEEGTKKIAKGLLKGCDGIEEIEIPETVTEIQEFAFSDCENLTEVVISDSVKIIGDSAFENCTALESVEFGENVSIIEGGAFAQCTALTSVVLPNSVVEIAALAFSGDEAITSLTLPSSLESIGYQGFKDCTGLTKIEIPKSLDVCDTWTGGVFEGCSNLKTVIFEEGTKKIAKGLLKGCDGIEEVEIPETVTEIQEFAFSDCENLTKVVIPDSVVTIGDYAFADDPDLTDVQIGQGLLNIKTYAFVNCTALESLVLPNSVKNLEGYIFEGCSKLATVTMSNNITVIPSYTFKECKKLATINMPTALTEIGDHAFYGCESLQEVVIPEGVTYIGGYAFEKCYDLEEVVIPNSVTEMGYGVFYEDSSLTDVTLGEGLGIIPYDTFKGCILLSSIVIPDYVTDIDGGAFAECTSLTDIFIPFKTTNIAEDAFSYYSRLTISSYTGSYAQEYAEEYGCDFVSVGSEPINLEYAQITILENGIFYDGTEKTPQVEVRVDGVIVPTTGYKISYRDNVEIGTATVVINGIERGGYREGKEEKFDIIPATPKLLSISQSEEGVTVKWKEVMGATGYEVYRKEANGTYQYIGSTSNLEYFDSGVNENTKYTYTVSANNFFMYGKYDETGISITTIKKYLTVNYDANGGSVSSSTVTVKNGTAIGTLPTPKRTGYTFTGWYTAKSGGTKITSTTKVTKDMTIYAQWKINTYTVTYDANGGTTSVDKAPVNHGSTIAAMPTPKRTNYTFNGWYTAKSGGSKVTSTTKITKNMTLYARWTIVKRTIKFNANGGKVTATSIKVNHGAKLGTLPTPKRTGYTFKGWYTAKSGGTKVTSTTKATKNRTLYARWTVNKYTVKFNANGGKTSVTSKTVTYNKKIGTLTTPKRTGYTFKGWYTAKSGGSKVTSTTKITKNMTLYARWTVNKYTVKFNANGGKTSVTSKTVTYNKKIGTLPTPKRTGYTFKGWYTAKSGGTKITTSKVIKSNTTFYARWKKK